MKDKTVVHKPSGERRPIARTTENPFVPDTITTPRSLACDVPDISDTEEARLQAEIAADPDNPEITDDEVARMRSAAEVLPAGLYAALVARSRGRPKLDHPKVAVKLRLDSSTLDAFKATGPGWQTRINAALALAARDLRAAAPTGRG